MKRDALADLPAFAAVAEAASFSRAAARLGVSRSAVSHTLRALETRLGVRLLNRTTRSVRPTPAGARLLTRLGPVFSEVEAALEELDAGRDEPAGRVRISAHRTAAFHAVLPRLAVFADAWPKVQVELAVDDGLVDIVAQGFDAGVRPGPMLAQDMISVRIGSEQPTVVVAAPGYLARFGRPQTPADLSAHRCLNYRYTSSGAIHRWPLARGEARVEIAPPGPFVTNDVNALIDAAVSGLGVALLTHAHVAPHLASGALETMMDDWTVPVPANHIYYPSRRQNAPALRVLVAALRVDGDA